MFDHLLSSLDEDIQFYDNFDRKSSSAIDANHKNATRLDFMRSVVQEVPNTSTSSRSILSLEPRPVTRTQLEGSLKLDLPIVFIVGPKKTDIDKLCHQF